MSLIWLGLGGLLGVLNLTGQWWSVQRLTPSAPKAGLIWLTAGFGLRWLVIIGLFLAALRQGALPALLLLAGMWLARWVGLAWLEIRHRATE